MSKTSPITSPGVERRDDAKARWDELLPAYQRLATDLR